MKRIIMAGTLVSLCSSMAVCADTFTQREKFSSHQESMRKRVHPPNFNRNISEAERAVEEARRELHQSHLEHLQPNTPFYQDPASQQRLDRNYFQNLRDYRDAQTELYWQRVKEQHKKKQP